MTKSRTIFGLCLAVLVLSGVAAAQPTNSAVAMLNSPMKVDTLGAGPTLVRSAAWAGSANFGLCEDLSDNTLYGTDLYSGTIFQYDKALNLLGSIPGVAGLQTGIAYDPVGDSFFVIDYLGSQAVELDKTGTPTGFVVSLLAIPGLSAPGPATIDPADPSTLIWLEDIGLDTNFQIDLTGAVLNSHANPDDTGSGAYGNGLSYDAFDAFSPPGNLHMPTGLLGEGQVSRMYEGQPSAAFPRVYVDILDISSFDTFINGVQNTIDGTASPDEVWYMQANSSNNIIEVNDVPVQPIEDCAPGGVNLGTQAPACVFFDDMESGEQAWWSHGADVGVDDWAIVSTGFAQSPVNAWFSEDVATVTDKHLDLTVDITAPATELSFWHTFDFESFFDGGQLQVSTDGGANFTLLDSEIMVGGYPGSTFSTCCGNPAGGEPGWGNGTLGAMTEVLVDMSAYTGTGIVIRWRAVSDGSVSNPGWYIDDVCLRQATNCDGNLAQVQFVNRSPATTIFSDDMESGEQAWFAHSAVLGIDDWAVASTPYASSPLNAWTCIDDTTYTDKRLDLTVDLTAPDTELRFMHTFDLESGYDGVNLSISTDGGANFTLLDSEIVEGGYTGTISTSFGNPIAGENAWTGTTPGFGPMTAVKVDLSAYAPTVGAIVRWRFGGDSCCGPGSLGGYQMDDVALGAPAFSGTGDDDYTVEFGTTDPLSFVLDEPPSRVGDAAGTKACMYIWDAAPTSSDVVTVPKGLGPMCFGVYFQPATVLPIEISNGIGAFAKLGANGSPSPPGIPEGGNFEWKGYPGGVGQAWTATFQGIIEDNCSQGRKPYSVTNGILLIVQ